MEIDARESEKSLSFCCLKIDNVFCVSRLTREGSGTTLIACEELNRQCFMMEYNPTYVDVIIKRWENLTGEKAIKLN